MEDDKNKQDGRDRSRVSGSEGYELAYLADKLGVTREEILDAIAAVGSDRERLSSISNAARDRIEALPRATIKKKDSGVLSFFCQNLKKVIRSTTRLPKIKYLR